MVIRTHQFKLACLFILSGSDKYTVDGTDITKDWLHFSLKCVSPSLFGALLFVSDSKEYVSIAADCGWNSIFLKNTEFSFVLRNIDLTTSGCTHFAIMEGAKAFPKQSSWDLTLKTVMYLPKQIISLAINGRRHCPYVFPVQFLSDTNRIGEISAIGDVLSMYPSLVRTIDAPDWYDTNSIPLSEMIPAEDPASYLRDTIKPVISTRLYTDEKAFGPGISSLLSKIDQIGSLRAAAQELGMSYSKAFNIVKNSEKALGFKLTTTSTGGTNGGGAELTREAKLLIMLQKDFSDKIKSYANTLLVQEMEQYFPAPNGKE